MHLGGVAIAGQQHPGLALLAQAQKVALAVQLDLVGLLVVIEESRVAPALDLGQRPVVEDCPIGRHQSHGALGRVALVGVYIVPTLVLRVGAGEVHGGHGRGGHHLYLERSQVRQGHGEGVAAVGGLAGQGGQVHLGGGSLQGEGAQVAGKGKDPALTLGEGEVQCQAGQVGGGRQE